MVEAVGRTLVVPRCPRSCRRCFTRRQAVRSQPIPRRPMPWHCTSKERCVSSGGCGIALLRGIPENNCAGELICGLAGQRFGYFDFGFRFDYFELKWHHLL